MHSCRSFNCKRGCRSGPAAPAGAESVPLYYLDQNQSAATTYQVTRAQATAMKAAGRGRFINRGKAFQLQESSPQRLNFFCSASSDSTASISLSEMLANVGITPNNGSPNEPALRHVVVFARQKINAMGLRLPGTFDAKAPLAFGAGSWPVGADAPN